MFYHAFRFSNLNLPCFSCNEKKSVSTVHLEAKDAHGHQQDHRGEESGSGRNEEPRRLRWVTGCNYSDDINSK